MQVRLETTWDSLTISADTDFNLLETMVSSYKESLPEDSDHLQDNPTLEDCHVNSRLSPPLAPVMRPRSLSVSSLSSSASSVPASPLPGQKRKRKTQRGGKKKVTPSETTLITSPSQLQKKSTARSHVSRSKARAKLNEQGPTAVHIRGKTGRNVLQKSIPIDNNFESSDVVEATSGYIGKDQVDKKAKEDRKLWTLDELRELGFRYIAVDQ
jgi:hypothetical protein